MRFLPVCDELVVISYEIVAAKINRIFEITKKTAGKTLPLFKAESYMY